VIRKYINFTYKDLRAIGLGTVLVNFIIQKIFRVNCSLPFMLHYTSRVNCPSGIKIDRSKESSSVYQCFASSNGCYMNGFNGIEISKNVIFASGVKLLSTNHDFAKRQKKTKNTPIIINKNVWLGANVVVLPGVVIGENSIIGAGSIVTKDIASNVIAVGNPAVVIKKLKTLCAR